MRLEKKNIGSSYPGAAAVSSAGVSRPPRPAAAALATVLALLALGGLLLALEPVRDAFAAVVRGDTSRLRDQLAREGAAAALVLVGLALMHVVVPFPAELPTAAAGFALGFAVAMPLMLAAWLVSGLVAYAVALQAGRPALRRVAGLERLERVESFVARGGARGLLIARLIPFVPFNLVCFASGATRVPLGRYTWTTLVGLVPLTTLTVLLGSRLQEPSLSDPLLWGTLVALLVTIAAAGPVGRRALARVR